MKVIFAGNEIICEKAVKLADGAKLYDSADNCIAMFSDIYNFDDFTLDGGEWEAPALTQADKLREDVDYLLIAEMTREGLL